MGIIKEEMMREKEKFAREMGTLLEDWLPFEYYRSCVEMYPRSFLEDTLAYVMRVPGDLIIVPRKELFRTILKATYVDPEDMPLEAFEHGYVNNKLL